MSASVSVQRPNGLASAGKGPKFGVVRFPGSNCDQDAYYALRDVFGLPRWILYLAPAEKRMVQRAFANEAIPSAVCSWGLDPPPPGTRPRDALPSIRTT